ncbi:hypothetical protein FQN50_007237 [Emmonsiellopsis sp. PD_5]|nr:hypothetical protein FQN50_007237 [Emmonsiellopsis sp. PD_5]
MRPVPDNQEAFMSNTTHTSILTEITERLELDPHQLQEQLQSQPATASSSTSSATPTIQSLANTNINDPLTQDLTATAHHLHELCEVSGDSYDILDSPRPINLPKIPNAPAYLAQALLTSRPRYHHQLQQPQGISAALSATAAAPPGTGETSTCHFLLIRLKEKSTDIIVYIVVPHAELESGGDPAAVAREEMFAHEAMGRVVDSFEIRDYGLFV